MLGARKLTLIIEMPQTTQTISTHLFLFPFRWDIIGTEKTLKDSSYDDRTRLFSNDENLCFDKILIPDKSNSPWERKQFTPTNSHFDYNQYHYFYEFVRSALFDNSLLENNNLRTYHWGKGKNLRFQITIEIDSDEKNDKIYNLKLDSIQLNAYEVGVGILSFHLSTDSVTLAQKPDFDSKDVLLINDFGRRLYPQFLGDNFNIETPKNVFLAKNISILYYENSEIITYENFDNDYAQNPDFLPKHILEILGKDAFTNILDENTKPSKPQIKIHPLIDDRMFVLSLLADNAESENIKNYSNDEVVPYNNEFDFWQQFVFVDGKSPTSPDFYFAKQILSKATYTRWLPNSTLFGVSRYSFVMLSSEGWFHDNILKNHLKTIYFQMIQLALLQRATILRFSSEVTRISLEIDKFEKDNEGFAKITNDVRIIYKNYIQFRNQLHFREITAQEQGVELYDMIQNTMRIETHIKALDAEIDELHRYLKLVNDDNASKLQETETQNINRLTKMAGAFGVASLIISYFGYGLISFPKVAELSQGQTSLVFMGIVLLLILTLLYFFPRKEKKHEKKNELSKPFNWKNSFPIVLIIMGLCSLGLPLFLLESSNTKTKDVPNIDSVLKANNRVFIQKIDSLKSVVNMLKIDTVKITTSKAPKKP